MKTLYDISVKGIDHKPFDLNTFKGKKLLIVNVASECGFTPQYAQLQELYENFGEKLNILACPCNDFGGQEPGDEQSITQFCITHYGVRFPMTEKIGIRKEIHLLYAWLCARELNGVADAEVRWNFHKFMVDENGQWLASFPSTVSPLDDAILQYLN